MGFAISQPILRSHRQAAKVRTAHTTSLTGIVRSSHYKCAGSLSSRSHTRRAAPLGDLEAGTTLPIYPLCRPFGCTDGSGL
jgi:hypothetical protein